MRYLVFLALSLAFAGAVIVHQNASHRIVFDYGELRALIEEASLPPDAQDFLESFPMDHSQAALSLRRAETVMILVLLVSAGLMVVMVRGERRRAGGQGQDAA